MNEIPLIENSVSKEAAKLSGIHVTLYNDTDREKSVKDENYYIMCVPKLAQNFKSYLHIHSKVIAIRVFRPFVFKGGVYRESDAIKYALLLSSGSANISIF